ncbi:hypothetical protein INT48_002033 [Thamnidium elegans]|uniref:peptide chain release factor N(5)-glutamine methyltransferase n=1 Tax=Thamnidium elegans TaxID=101142 RepID=A0A8H7W395_9FUNG|nr:hypothetical protein INT48_002033 [Thamnidium elegans]
MSKGLVKQNLKWAQKLLPACDGDLSHAKRQLVWLKEKVVFDHRGKQYSSLDTLSQQEQERLETYIDQRVNQYKPLQYILGSTQPFCELDIVTRPPTLIPRWETEEWTFKVIKLMHQHLDQSRPLRVLDICTGSGCIALALAKHLPKDSAEIIGLDISNKAIDLANHNLNLHKSDLQNSVEFQQKDLFDLDLNGSNINLVISNPPYITHQEYESLDPDVKYWEDSRALVTDDQGTHIHKKIIQLAKYCQPLDNIPRLLMEMGGTHQVNTLTKQMQLNGFNNITVWKDLAEKDRVIYGF